MKDRLAKYPGRYTAIVDTEKIEKGVPFNIEIARDDEPTVEGTPYNKEAVLPDSVAEAICPDVEDPTPADAFNALNTKKAPAGYGLGEASSRSQYNWADTVNGFKRGNTGSPDGEWWHGLVCKEYGNITTNLAFKPNNGVWLSAMRGRTSDGTWGKWEYVNPPMLEGVEYRTTERFNGRPVYAQLFNCGTLPNASYKEYIVTEATKSNILDVVRFDGYLEHNGGYSDKIPISTCESLNITFYGDNRFRITTTTNQSAWDAYIAVYYTLSE